MDVEEEELITKFKEISNKKWIKSISNSFGSIGLTFEKELGKKADSLYFPDYCGIELKCTSRYSRYPLYLFAAAFDGPTFPEINRITEKYGWYDKDYPNKKVLFTSLKYNEKVLVNKKYKFKLEFDNNDDKLFLCVYNLDDELIEKKSFIYSYSLYNHLCLKLKKLAVVHASIKKNNGVKHFRYYSISIYKLISFEKFIELLKCDVIGVSLIVRISKSGTDRGRYRNKNLTFNIKKKDIEKLFTKIFSYNHDLEN